VGGKARRAPCPNLCPSLSSLDNQCVPRDRRPSSVVERAPDALCCGTTATILVPLIYTSRVCLSSFQAPALNDKRG